jgi:hypothetical protein
MSKDKKERPGSEDAEIEREIRLGRKFSLAEAIGRMGGGLLKGASPVTADSRRPHYSSNYHLFSFTRNINWSPIFKHVAS